MAENITQANEPDSFALKYTKTQINEMQLLTEIENADIQINTFQEENKKSYQINGIQSKILIVEDNIDMITFISNELQQDYILVLAHDGVEGLKRAKEEIPDLIISDVMMPHMNGIEMCEKLKNDYATSHIPIILLTAKAGEDNMIEGLKTGADDYINKPFNIQALKLKLDNLIHSRKLLRDKFINTLLIKPKELSTSKVDEEFLLKAFEIVEKNMSNVNFSNDEFIQQLGYGRTIAYNKIKAMTNQSLGEFIKTIRLKKAAQILLHDEHNITEVAYLVGYKYRESFYKHFTAMFKKSPSQFIKEHKNSTTNESGIL